MSTGEWIPQDKAQQAMNSDDLKKLAQISYEGKLATLADELSPREQAELAAAMQAGREQWQAAAEPLSDDELLDLIKTLAIAEMELPNCNLGARSAVIHINRLLKRRGRPLDEEALLWLKHHSSNRFLPNGPIL